MRQAVQIIQSLNDLLSAHHPPGTPMCEHDRETPISISALVEATLRDLENCIASHSTPQSPGRLPKATPTTLGSGRETGEDAFSQSSAPDGNVRHATVASVPRISYPSPPNSSSQPPGTGPALDHSLLFGRPQSPAPTQTEPSTAAVLATPGPSTPRRDTVSLQQPTPRTPRPLRAEGAIMAKPPYPSLYTSGEPYLVDHRLPLASCEPCGAASLYQPSPPLQTFGAPPSPPFEFGDMDAPDGLAGMSTSMSPHGGRVARSLRRRQHHPYRQLEVEDDFQSARAREAASRLPTPPPSNAFEAVLMRERQSAQAKYVRNQRTGQRLRRQVIPTATLPIFLSAGDHFNLERRLEEPLAPVLGSIPLPFHTPLFGTVSTKAQSKVQGSDVMRSGMTTAPATSAGSSSRAPLKGLLKRRRDDGVTGEPEAAQRTSKRVKFAEGTFDPQRSQGQSSKYRRVGKKLKRREGDD